MPDTGKIVHGCSIPTCDRILEPREECCPAHPDAMVHSIPIVHRFTVREPGSSSWAETFELADAQREQQRARDLGLGKAIIVDEETGEEVRFEEVDHE